MLHRVVTVVGTLILFYAGYTFRDRKLNLKKNNGSYLHIGWFHADISVITCAYLDKKYLIRIGETVPESLLTTEVIVEVVVGFLLVLVGQLLALRLKPVRIAANIPAVSFEETWSDSDFITFNHRGQSIQKRIAAKNKR